MESSIALVCTAPEREPEAAALADGFGLRREDHPPTHGDRLALVLTANRLELRAAGRAAPGPLAVDFTAGRQYHRGRRASIRDEALARAAGIGRGWRPEVIDATAGLGRDSFLLASMGCSVTACERNPVVAALLADGLARAKSAAATRDIARRIHLRHCDALAVLAERASDVILVDPMHPPRRKSAAVKKEMRLLQQLVGADPDSTALLAAALGAARHRVVVKRPARAEPLPGPAPFHTVSGRSTRFDVYAGHAEGDAGGGSANPDDRPQGGTQTRRPRR